ncbi:protein translocase subunit SecDF [Mesomycoplasma lagogenitalium]|uniref:Protein translocase subunit SecDF n=1 Tax=Mesomycoplasma lagogenitalium TaxID=171286 RepID=A0ABY8LT33_9BACT|nr:protein translocase subunit SecDF [Mesomycoplasma lagogenitalium]WGI36398.1 protein translocase subunit SecDF [Mesomycoplasma lagogenitalium]
MKNWKRWLIAFFTFSSVLVTITLGSKYYISKNANKSIEYGGGAELLVEVKTNNDQLNKEIIEKADTETFDRLTGGTGLSGTQVNIQGDGKIKISQNGIHTVDQLSNFVNQVTKKQYLIATDMDGKPLFLNGKFVADQNVDYNDLQNFNENLYSIPIKPGGAFAQIDHNNRNQISVALKDNEAQVEWTKATEYISKKDQNKKALLIWTNLKDLISMAKNDFASQWANAKYNPYNFVYVNEDPNRKNIGTNQKIKFSQPILKQEQFDARKYLISVLPVFQPLTGETFIIQNDFSSADAKQLALDINYGAQDYHLKLLSSSFISFEQGNQTFNYLLIAGIVVLSLISIFLMVNYGLLGFLSTISMSLYIFLTLLLFTTVRGEYSPSTVAALILGIGLAIDSNITMFERFKKEVYYGSNLLKANSKSNKFSLPIILDYTVVGILFSVLLFFLGEKETKIFASTLLFSLIFTIIIMLFFTRAMATLLIKTGIFDERKQLLGIQKKYLQKFERGYTPLLERPDYIKISKFSNYVPLAIFIVAIIVFTVFASINKNFLSGFNLSVQFGGGASILIESADNNGNLINFEKALKIKEYLENQGINNDNNQIVLQKISNNFDIYNVSVVTNQNISDIVNKISNDIQNQFTNINFITYNISAQESNLLVINTIISLLISLLVAIIYIFIRLKWTYAIAIIISLLHNVLIVLLLFIIFRIEISNSFILAMLVIIGFSISDSTIISTKIRETIKDFPYQEVQDAQRLKSIVNKTIRDSIKRSLFISAILIISTLILISFNGAINLNFAIAIIFGFIFTSYSSLFIAPFIWLLIENIRNKRKSKRIRSGYWNTQKVKEQTFHGINDFQH